MKLIDDFLLDQISEEYCESYRNLHRDELTNKVRKTIENIFLKFREYSKEEILKALIVFSLFEPDYCIKLARRKGVFRYSERGGYATYYMQELLKHKKYLFFSDNTISYIENKLDNKWMQEYYIKSEEKLNKEILKHYQKCIRKNICGRCFETSLILELMSYMEMIFRTNCAVASKQVKKQQLFRDRIEGFSQEEISEAISYLIYLDHKMNPIKKNRTLWLDTNYVNSLNIVDLILEACKRNQLIEWEVMIDYLG